MKIEELIEAFEKAIPTYQQAVDENWDYTTLRMNWMHGGICLFCKEILEIDIYDTIETYYKNYIINEHGYLFKDIQYHYSIKQNIEICIKPRLDFMKKEVKELKKLLKQGYTHV